MPVDKNTILILDHASELALIQLSKAEEIVSSHEKLQNSEENVLKVAQLIAQNFSAVFAANQASG